MWGYWIFIVFEAIAVHLLLPVGELAMSDSFYVALICINTVILIFVLSNRYGHDGNFLVLITGALLFRIALMFWSEYFSHIFTLPNSGADEMTYYYNAMSNLVKDKMFTGYAQFFAWQAKIFGLSKIYGKFINVLFSISAILILRNTLFELKSDYRVSIKTLTFACFLPNFAILSALLLRESVIILLVSISVNYLVRWWKHNGIKELAVALAATAVAAWFHSGMIAYSLGLLSLVVASRYTPSGRTFSLPSFRTIVLTVSTTAVVLMVLMNLNLGLTNYFRGADSLTDIVSIADAYEEGGSAYNANIVSNDTTLGFIINTPVRMFFFMFAPVPWNWRSATDAIAFLFSGLFYGYVFFTTVPYVFKRKRLPAASGLFLIALLVLMMFGWGVSNSGTALRHRDKMVIHYLLMYAMISNEKLREKLEEGYVNAI
jgi:hypothetical protein